MLRKLLTVLFIGTLFAAVGQQRPGELRGQVTDKKTGEPVPLANVVVKLNGEPVSGTTTDFDGRYVIKPIDPGRYEVEMSFLGYATQPFKGVIISPNKTTTLNAGLTEEAEVLGEVEVIEYTVPLIDPDKQGKTATGEEIQNLPQRDVASIASTSAGVYQQDDGSGINVRGSRSNATDVYIDGIKVRGATTIPQTAIDQLTIITGGLPAQYGDATGGIISMTTRGPSNKYFGGLEANTSSIFDEYNQSLLGFSLSGPLARRKDGSPLFGFFIAGEYQYQRDPRPSAIGTWKVNDGKLRDLEESPYRPAGFGGGVLRNSEFLRESDLRNIDYKQNNQREDLRFSAKFDLKTSKTTNLTFGGTFNWAKGQAWQYNYSLLNPTNNPEFRNRDWRVFARFQQRFVDAEDESAANNIKNAFYSLQVDYSEVYRLTQDDTHFERLWDYGYIGKFDRLQAPTFSYGLDTVSGLTGWLQTNIVDTLVTFEPGDKNPNATNYTEQYWDFVNGDVNSIFVAQGQGALLNGQRPANNYSLWFNTGRQWNGYNFTDNNQFRVVGSGSADIKNHSIILGFEYEQRVDRFWSVAPVGLWGLARQLTNAHLTELDFDNPIVGTDGNGNFNDTITYNRFYNGATQSYFDQQLRTSLGLAVDDVSFINTDALDPNQLDIEYFSADELLNNGNAIVAYAGYDAYGNKLDGPTSFEDFFSETDDNGNLKRHIDAFRPIYIAGYIQDKFQFNDLVFNIGVRVDRFDANQKVLVDQYSMFPTISAQEMLQEGALGVDALPANIGDDFVVYVNDLTEPTRVVGYRDDNQWYDADGNQIADPQSIAQATTTGVITPYLEDPDNTNLATDLTAESFEDYTPQVNVMPRISFNFPISDQALFFAHYDILTQRPQSNVRFDPTDYLYLEANQGNVLNNPNLRPERTIDYEVGFKQTLSKRSAITLSAFYRELRDMIQATQVNFAYPVNYTTFGNLDFGTVKGFSVSYDLRRTGNVSLNFNYTLQFADGSGSNATTGLSLVQQGQPNLRVIQPLDFDQRHTLVAVVDYRFSSGKDYNGPVWFGSRVFENAGANFTFRAGSGTPYTRQANVLQSASFGINQRPILQGSINGSRLPWQFRIDMRLNKQFNLKWGGKEDGSKQKTANMNVYLDVQNLLNALNVINVYRYTGNPDDDGFLSSAEAQEIIAQQTDSQSFIDLYTVKVNSPFNYSLPRRMRLGVLLSF